MASETFNQAEVTAYYKIRVPSLKRRNSAELRGPCPVHNGKDDNFSVNSETGVAFCHSRCNHGWDMIGLERELTGADFQTAKAEIYTIIGRHQHRTEKRSRTPQITKTYDYRDESGKILFQTVRYDPKDFKQRRPAGKGWINNLNGVRLVPFKLPELLRRNSDMVFVCEGEKDVLALEKWGLLATCNPLGAGKWRDSYSVLLSGRSCVILPDNDDAGRSHAISVAASLLNNDAQVRIVQLPNLPVKGDFSDWQQRGGSQAELLRLAETHSPVDDVSFNALASDWGGRSEKSTEQSPQPGAIATRCIAEITAKPVHWLWPQRIARGKLSIIAGDPGLGKSQITASLAATVSTGGLWPASNVSSECGGVLFLSAEDDPADTLRPRLEAARADLQRIHIVEGVTAGYTGEGKRRDRSFSLAADIEALRRCLIEDRSIALVVIDPITAYLGEVDSHKNAEVRALLAPLSQLAGECNVAVVAVSHLSKAQGQKALMRVTGSLAFVAAARSAYLVVADQEVDGRRLFLPLKNNIGPDSSGFAFTIAEASVQSAAGPITTSKICWENEMVQVSADEIIDANRGGRSSSAVDDASEWLRSSLAAGPAPSSDLFGRAAAAGISEKTLRRASRVLGVAKKKSGMKDGWTWSLPPKMANSAEDGQALGEGTFEDSGHLRADEGTLGGTESAKRTHLCPQCEANQWVWKTNAWVCGKCGSLPVDCAPTTERPMSPTEVL